MAGDRGHGKDKHKAGRAIASKRGGRAGQALRVSRGLSGGVKGTPEAQTVRGTGSALNR